MSVEVKMCRSRHKGGNHHLSDGVKTTEMVLAPREKIKRGALCEQGREGAQGNDTGWRDGGKGV